jgi:DNA recombination protein RmuC
MEIIITILTLGFGVVILLLLRSNRVSQTGMSQEERATLQAEIHQLNIDNATAQERISHLLKSESELKYSIDQQKDELVFLRKNRDDDKAMIVQLQTTLDEQKRSMQDKLVMLQENEVKLKEEFTNLANEILEKNSQKLQEQSEKGLGNLLNPMKIQLADFKKKVEDVYDKEAKDRTALHHELKSLKELNLKMSSDATNLTNALKGQNKQQGVWGEMVLEKVLESSGLREGHEYNREVSLKDDEDRAFRPDVIVNLPDDRHIIIDAKTSLSAYNAYMSETDEERKQEHIKNHTLSIKSHVKGLASKKYEDLDNVNSLDFIFMFVPIEGALMLALEKDVNLYDDSFKQKIILVSPTTLLVALRAVENTWRYERQAQSIADVAKRAEQLYSKFTDFVTDLEKVGESLKKADSSYQEAFKKLKSGKGNLIRQATQLKEVSNIKSKKDIAQTLVDEAMLEEN